MENFEINNGILTKYKGSDKNVIIPESVTSIGEKAFLHNSDLTIIS
jgi:hypothetical protein